MAEYLIEVNYTPEAWARMIQKPQNRGEIVGKAVAKLGGTVTGFWGSLGDQDVVGIVSLPDDVSAAAFSMAISAGGSCSRVKTTQLLSADQAMAAMKKAKDCGYKPVK